MRTKVAAINVYCILFIAILHLLRVLLLLLGLPDACLLTAVCYVEFDRFCKEFKVCGRSLLLVESSDLL